MSDLEKVMTSDYFADKFMTENSELMDDLKLQEQVDWLRAENEKLRYENTHIASLERSKSKAEADLLDALAENTRLAKERDEARSCFKSMSETANLHARERDEWRSAVMAHVACLEQEIDAYKKDILVAISENHSLRSQLLASEVEREGLRKALDTISKSDSTLGWPPDIAREAIARAKPSDVVKSLQSIEWVLTAVSSYNACIGMDKAHVDGNCTHCTAASALPLVRQLLGVRG